MSHMSFTQIYGLRSAFKLNKLLEIVQDVVILILMGSLTGADKNVF